MPRPLSDRPTADPRLTHDSHCARFNSVVHSNTPLWPRLASTVIHRLAPALFIRLS
ncbi:hypothetical protein BC831DRAFT_456501 [Entophlyctis helioformis]|nr:hypothetical protein BC831DRAFT_456501 [Entophlyctis helioformis]